MLMLLGAISFIACEPIDPIDPNGPGKQPQDTTTVDSTSTVAPDTIGWNIPAECLTVAQAREICAKLADNATTGKKYYVKGWVKKLANKHAAGISDFGNALFYMEDVKGADSKDDFYAYQVYGLNGSQITNPDAVAVGDYVVIYGELTNFKYDATSNNVYETVGRGAAYIWKSTNTNLTDTGNGNQGTEEETKPGQVTGEGTFEKPYTAADVLTLNNTKTGTYWVKAYIVGQVNGAKLTNAEFNAPFTPSTNQNTGQLNTYNTNLLIAVSADETNPDKCVPVQLPSGALRSGLNLPENPTMDGQEILIYGSFEKYFSVAGIKSPSYAKVGDKEFGTHPDGSGNTGDGTELLNETLMSQASFDKFTAVNVSGDQVWTFDTRYGAKMSGFANNATHPNEDWFITPALDLTGKTSVTISFDHAFGPAAQVPNTEATKAQYTIWVSNDFESDVKTATWTELKGMVYGTSAWGYVSSGEITIPTANLKANCRIAWKYVCNDVSATWEIKNVVVK